MKRSISLGHLRRLAHHGGTLAQFELACQLESQLKFHQARPWYVRASRRGHVGARQNLYLLHVLGYLKPRSWKRVINFLKDRAVTGDADCENNLGLCYLFGTGVKQKHKLALKWFRRAARKGLAAAQFNLGGMYWAGKGVRRSPQIAARWYKRAAEQKHELSLLKLGHMYQHGAGVPMDYGKALALYFWAYKEGSVRAAVHLGFLFRKGLGVRPDPRMAFSLFAQSLERPDMSEAKENPSYRRSSYYWLGRGYEEGKGTERNLNKARKWYRKAARLGDVASRSALERIRQARAAAE